MPRNSSPLDRLHRLFRESFAARDIAEPLLSLDETTPAPVAKRFMGERRFRVLGIRRDGLVAGFVERADVGEGTCGESLRLFDESQIVLDSTPLHELVTRLQEHSHLFVSILGCIGAVVSRSDLQKPAVRMWLFGLVTLLEMRFTALIEQFVPETEWQSLLSEGRMRKARSLLEHRAKREQHLTLLDCLQLSDKSTIVARNPQLRAMTRFDSKRQLEEATRMLERLRNSLAHSQDIVSNDWRTIVLLTERLDSILEGPEIERQNAEIQKSFP